jgi:hypothetical protein
MGGRGEAGSRREVHSQRDPSARYDPLTGGNGNPWIGGDRKDSPIAVVKTGADSGSLRLRVRFVDLQKVVDGVGREAARAATDTR